MAKKERLFSERQGLIGPKDIQIDSIDEHLKTRLWNILRLFLHNKARLDSKLLPLLNKLKLMKLKKQLVPAIVR